ncbi:hypothetical protein [Desulfobacter vibrioformis]|uniref:hypothetical protein n=1 Tax=Desulfobacter vibrioformis TaxID=34031 RepID=UPI0005515F52|nr:hypothetical protein [Desulfobacter vibrioformis]
MNYFIKSQIQHLGNLADPPLEKKRKTLARYFTKTKNGLNYAETHLDKRSHSPSRHDMAISPV